MNDNRKLLVTYLDTPGTWKTIAPVLRTRLPLRGVEWTNPIKSQAGNRLIPSLELDFVRFTPEVFPKNVPGLNIHQGPFLHIYFVAGEVSSLYSAVKAFKRLKYVSGIAVLLFLDLFGPF